VSIVAERVMDFHSLYEQYSADVHRFALYLCGDSALADDLTSEAFVRVWTAPGEIRLPTIKAFLFAIVRNLHRTGLRGRHRSEALGQEPVSEAVSVEVQLAAKSELALVMRALTQLSEIDRAALLMRAQDDMSYEEIGGVLGLTPAAVRVRVHRARLRLAELVVAGR
jgi:RNA polymerase sigma-70 factor (ECF subfamily)